MAIFKSIVAFLTVWAINFLLFWIFSSVGTFNTVFDSMLYVINIAAISVHAMTEARKRIKG